MRYVLCCAPKFALANKIWSEDVGLGLEYTCDSEAAVCQQGLYNIAGLDA